MKKLLLAALLFSTTSVYADVLQCDSSTFYRGVGNGQYLKITDPQSTKRNMSIELTHAVITLTVNDHVVEFWKDYDEYRNNDGKLVIDKSNDTYTMLTAIPNDAGSYDPIKVVYHCK